MNYLETKHGAYEVLEPPICKEYPKTMFFNVKKHEDARRVACHLSKLWLGLSYKIVGLLLNHPRTLMTFFSS